MDYNEAIDYIHSTHKFGSKLGLENITKLMDLLGNPQNKLKIIHIAGTNGKGSTSNMIHDVLASAGYKVGLFISPFLEEFTERIQINGNNINKENLAKTTALVKDKVNEMLDSGSNHPTEFEIVTAIGFQYFYEHNVDFVILEVGMGGRFDSTNVIEKSIVSIITSISVDHVQYLGDTVEKIAFEKAGIIKENGDVVVYPQDFRIVEVIKKQAEKKNASIYETSENDIQLLNAGLFGQDLKYLKNDVFKLPTFKLGLLGEHQIYNCVTALRALEILKNKGYNITEENIINGLCSCKFAGRFEVINQKPIIILDGGHNISGIESFTNTIKKYMSGKKIILFYGMLKDKNPSTVIDYLLSISKKIYTLTPDNPRAIDAKDMSNLINNYTNIASPLCSVDEAINIIKKSDSDDCFAFAGSLYMLGEVRTKLKDNGFMK